MPAVKIFHVCCSLAFHEPWAAVPYRREHFAGERGGPPDPNPLPEEREND